MKKAGIVICIFFFIVAILLCVFGLKLLNKSDTNSVQNEVVESVENNQEVQNQGNQNVENPPVQTPPEQIQQQTPPVQTQGGQTEIYTEKVVTKEISGVMTIDENSLGTPIATKEVIVHITNKRIMMIDEDTDSKEPKMLTYCFDVLTPENMKLTLFVTNSVYTLYNVGDMLKVNYVIYTNDNGIQFPLVLNVLDVQ